MNRGTEVLSGITPIEGLTMYSGIAVNALPRRVLTESAKQIHVKLGEGKQKGHMHQPGLDTLVAGMEEGNFVLSMQGDLVVATSHLRPAKSGSDNRELGGVVKLINEPGQGRLVALLGAQLAVFDHHAVNVEALVAERNKEGLAFFQRIGIETGRRKSDYVKNPEGDGFADMVIFDVTHLAREEAF